MGTVNIAEIKKTDWSVAANFETVGPKRNATVVNNAERETASTQARAAEKSLKIAIGPEDEKILQAIQWLSEERPAQLTRALTSDLDYSSSASAAFAVSDEMRRNSIAAQTMLMPSRAKHQLQDLINRMLLEA